MRYRENVSRKSLPSHVTENDVEPFVEVERLEADRLVAHRFVRRSGNKIAVLYETRWIGSTSSSWEREADLRRFWSTIL